MVLSVFGDESHDEKKQRLFVISVVFGSAADWASIEKTWIWRTSGKEFHAAHAEHEGERELYLDLTNILANSYVCGLSSVLDLAAFNELFPHALADNAYYKCLCDVISTLILMVRDWNSKTPNEPLTLEFTFDCRRQSDGNAGTLYSMLINLPEWEDASIFDTKITFDCRTNPRIQMADLLARETMKEFDRRFNKPGDPPRKQFQILEAKDKVRFLERDREYCKEWLSKMESLQAENGMSEKDYFDWLAKKGRVQNGKPHDNWRNRIQYFSWKETQPNLAPVFRKAQNAVGSA